MTNEELLNVQRLKEYKERLKQELTLLYDEYDRLVEEKQPNSVVNVVAHQINTKWDEIKLIDSELDRIYISEVERRKTQLAVIPEQEKMPAPIEEVPSKDKKAERKEFAARLGAGLLATAILGTGAYFLGKYGRCDNCNGRVVDVNDRALVEDEKTATITPTIMPTITPTNSIEPVVPTETPAPVEEEKPFESYGEFTDASDTEALEKRAGYYYDNYFAKIYDKDVLSKVITREEFIDIILVFNGKLPVDGNFNVNELMNYTNAAKQVMIFYASTEKDEENNTRKFVPMAPVFEDGSYEQKCALEVDEIMEPLINAMNEEKDEEFRKYAIMFGELMRDQYFLVDSTTNHYSVRSRASFAARPHLWKMSYAQYVGNIFEYGVKHDIDICIPLCYKYGTDEIQMVSLSKLMAMLEFVPMGQWDAVLQRAGMTIEEIKEFGNASVEDPMPVVFTRDAKNHFKELQNQMVLKNNK